MVSSPNKMFNLWWQFRMLKYGPPPFFSKEGFEHEQREYEEFAK